MNDGQQTDEIVHVVDGDRSDWALATEPAREVDLTAYFERVENSVGDTAAALTCSSVTIKVHG
jgi:hypothetical protein